MPPGGRTQLDAEGRLSAVEVRQAAHDAAQVRSETGLASAVTGPAGLASKGGARSGPDVCSSPGPRHSRCYDAAWWWGSFQFGLAKWHVYPFG